MRDMSRRGRAKLGARMAPRLVAAGLVTGLATFSLAVIPAPIAAAATDTVTNCAGSGAGSLPYEVQNAVSGDTVTFSVSCPPSSPIVLSSAIDITENLTINGPGASNLALTGCCAIVIFQVDSGVTATISGLTIENNNGSAPKYLIVNPGGIDNNGTLTLTDSTLSNNSAGYEGNGGGIENGGTLTVIGSTLSDNVAGGEDGGGGIWNDGGTLTVTDSTLSGNGGGNGGGISNDGGTVTVTDSTLAGNDAYDGGGVGGGIDNKAGTVTVVGSTLSNNTSIAPGGGIYNSGTLNAAATIVAESGSEEDCSGTITDRGYNIDDDGTCGFSAPSVSQSTSLDGTLGPLADNGGPTETIALLPGSPASRAVTSTALCSTPDQRGIVRPTPCDIGAYQFSTNDLSQTIAFTSTPPSSGFVGGPAYAASATASSGLPVVLGVDVSAVSVCSLSGDEVSFTGTGTCTIAANQVGDATYLAAPQVTQSFSVTRAPGAITSRDKATATAGSPFSFMVTTTGSPVPKITTRGTLPKHLRFVDNHNGTASISGTAVTSGVYHLSITARFGHGSTRYVVIEAFTLKVEPHE